MSPDTPSSLAAELRSARSAVSAQLADAAVAHDAAAAALADLNDALARTATATLALDDLAARVEALPAAAPQWLPAFPGDVEPGTIRWGQGGNTAARADEHEAATGVPLGVWRRFSNMGRVSSAVADCARALAAGRVPWLSMKLGRMWADVASGALDAELLVLFGRLADLGGPIWFTAHHEPEGGNGTPHPDEGEGSEGAWRAMQARVRMLLDQSGATNIAFAPVLMAWTWQPRSGRDPDDWWVPEARWDFYGIDLYQSSEAGPAPVTQVQWLNTMAWCAERDIRIGIAEWGNRGTDAQAAAEMTEVYEHLLDVGVIGAAYFDTPVNSGPEPYTLTGAPLVEFRRLMGDPRSVSLR